VDETSMLLERFADAQMFTVTAPPVSAIEALARRRTMLRAFASLSVVLVLVVGLVVGLASVGMASEHAPRSQDVTLASAAAR